MITSQFQHPDFSPHIRGVRLLAASTTFLEKQSLRFCGTKYRHQSMLTTSDFW
jgi:hypothetical protein